MCLRILFQSCPEGDISSCILPVCCWARSAPLKVNIISVLIRTFSNRVSNGHFGPSAISLCTCFLPCENVNNSFNDTKMGPVVQNFVSLTLSLNPQIVNHITTSKANTLLFVVEKYENPLHSHIFKQNITVHVYL